MQAFKALVSNVWPSWLSILEQKANVNIHVHKNHKMATGFQDEIVTLDIILIPNHQTNRFD